MVSKIYILNINGVSLSKILKLLSILKIKKIINTSSSLTELLITNIVSNNYILTDLKHKVPDWKPVRNDLLKIFLNDFELNNYEVHTLFDDFIKDSIPLFIEEDDDVSNILITVSKPYLCDSFALHFSKLFSQNHYTYKNLYHIVTDEIGSTFLIDNSKIAFDRNYDYYLSNQIDIPFYLGYKLNYDQEQITKNEINNAKVENYTRDQALRFYCVTYYPRNRFPEIKYKMLREEILSLKNSRPDYLEKIYSSMINEISKQNLKFDYIIKILGSTEIKYEKKNNLDIIIERLSKNYNVKILNDLFYKTNVNTPLKVLTKIKRKIELENVLRISSDIPNLNNKNFLLVDDVRTTGTSFNLYSNLIYQNYNNVRVFGIVYAQTIPL